MDLQGDRAVLSGPDPTVQAGGFFTNSGYAYVIQRSGTTWSTERQLAPSTAPADVGQSVALDGNDIFVSAPESNAVFLYDTDSPTCDFGDFCHGRGSDVPGCTPCPCGNETFELNPGGCGRDSFNYSGARLIAEGDPSQSTNSLSFRISSAGSNAFALLVSGASALPASPSNPCFGLDSGIGIGSTPAMDGLRCVGVNLIRHRVRPLSGTQTVWGAAAFPPAEDIVAEGGYVAGEQRYFQIFYRTNPATQCGTGINTSNGLRVLFRP